ncbi:MAG: DUF2225 domain-containing protein [Lachnospiraceae bacterium]|nr:DUF2225 domain-containing protein [Lachnospiraceae bacterium]
MDNIMSGLEKFGLSTSDDMFNDLFEEGKKKQVDENGEVKAEEPPKEEDFLLKKGARCHMCDKTFMTLQVKSGRVKRLESDDDLRPRFQYIDSLKYGLISCPYCGYTALTRCADTMTSVQRKLLQENVCAKFKPTGPVELPDSYTYDEAIERFKLALFNSVAKKDKVSEKAYLCLNIAWLLRGKGEELAANPEAKEEDKAKCKAEENAFYAQAYDGLYKAIQSESFPMCGMDEATMSVLLAVMSFKLGKIENAGRLVSSVLTSPSANQRMKNKALELKEKIIEEMKKKKAAGK